MLSINTTSSNELEQKYAKAVRPYELPINKLLKQQEQRESNARSYPRRIPLALKRAQGIYVEDVEGRVFIDCLAGAGTLALGHNHPLIVEAIEQTLKDNVPLHTLDLTTPIKEQFIEELFAILPQEFSQDAKVQFCSPAGTDAVEAALKLVKTAKGRGTILAFHGAYHGMTQGALHLMGNLSPKKSLSALQQGVQFLPYPYTYRCPFGIGGDAGMQAGLNYIETLLNDPESGVLHAAGMIMEAIQGEGGVIPAPEAWLRRIRELTSQADIPLIMDEIQSGLGRTGKMFAFEHAGITPDVITLSKAIGGSLPLAVMVYRGELDQWKPGAHAGTFRGNQLAMACGAATIRFIRKEKLHKHAEEMGERLQKGLKQLQQHFPQVGDVRGKGLMIGVEMIDPDKNAAYGVNRPAFAGDRARALQSECLRHGLILEVGGRFGSVLRFLPPLIINERQIDYVLEIFTNALANTARNE